MSSKADTLVVGYGSTLRGDDGAGLAAAERLRGRGFRVLAVPQLTPELAVDIAAASRVFFFDASVDVSPGEFRLIPLEPCAARPGALEHHSTPAGLLALAAELYDARPQATLVALGANSFEFGQELSPAVLTAIERAVELLLGLGGPD